MDMLWHLLPSKNLTEAQDPDIRNLNLAYHLFYPYRLPLPIHDCR